ncbi:MAG: ATP-dependent RNA helicase DbpA, partial [Cellvibrionales bacterium]|nr:ATP-dependent RNA helicase DbpA [Cellvibrionales bacterium]
MLVAFTDLGLAKSITDNLSDLGYDKMTPIQAESLPVILNKQDVIGQAKTGSGKTVAFALGVLDALDVKTYRVQSLILCPTRELADQVAGSMRTLARAIHNIKVLTLCGGLPFGPQVGSLEHGAHIVVGTPGRVEEHLRKGHLNLSSLKTLVLDEADRMLDMGFRESLDAIVDRTPSSRQTLLFSATFPSDIKTLTERITVNAVSVRIESADAENQIDEQWYEVEDNTRFDALRSLLLTYQPEQTVIFCNTKAETLSLASDLVQVGFSARALNGDLEQKKRSQVLATFANNSLSILVATDVAARGIDIAALPMVINYHIARDLEVHVHRIGRTGRAEQIGMAFTFFSEKERFKKEKLEAFLGVEFAEVSLPNPQILSMKPYYPVMRTIEIAGGKKQK